MDKIFRRATQTENTQGRKKNEKNRVRNTIMNFRVSPTEKKLIEARISVTGLPKTEFFIESCLYQTILVKGNIRAFAEISEKMNEIAEVIDKEPRLDKLTWEQAECLKTILEILDNRMKKD